MTGQPQRSGARRAPRIRMRTVVAGLIALVISASVLLHEIGDVVIPSQTLALAVLIGAGGLLLGNGIVTAIRRRRSGRAARPMSRHRPAAASSS